MCRREQEEIIYIQYIYIYFFFLATIRVVYFYMHLCVFELWNKSLFLHRMNDLSLSVRTYIWMKSCYSKACLTGDAIIGAFIMQTLNWAQKHIPPFFTETKWCLYVRARCSGLSIRMFFLFCFSPSLQTQNIFCKINVNINHFK